MTFLLLAHRLLEQGFSAVWSDQALALQWYLADFSGIIQVSKELGQGRGVLCKSPPPKALPPL